MATAISTSTKAHLCAMWPGIIKQQRADATNADASGIIQTGKQVSKRNNQQRHTAHGVYTCLA